MAIKYAFLTFALPFPFPAVPDRFDFDEQLSVTTDSVKNQLDVPESKHWPEWLGSSTWEKLGKRQLVLSTWAESGNPDVLDVENKQLLNRVSTAYRILPLVGSFAPAIDAYMFTGKGILANGRPAAQNIREFSRVRSWTRSLSFEDRTWEELFNWAKLKFKKETVLSEWQECLQHFETLFFKNKSNRQIYEAYRSFEEGFYASQLEFKIPNLVRAIECIVDCWGAKEFAQKLLDLIGSPASDSPFGVSNDTEKLLADLYQLRNDCSHGKPFAYSLAKAIGKAPEEELIVKYEFLAEWAARKVIRDSFTNSSILKFSHDRDSLVEAWKSGFIKR